MGGSGEGKGVMVVSEVVRLGSGLWMLRRGVRRAEVVG